MRLGIPEQYKKIGIFKSNHTGKEAIMAKQGLYNLIKEKMNVTYRHLPHNLTDLSQNAIFLLNKYPHE